MGVILTVGLAGALAASPAQAALCEPVSAGGKIAWRIHADNISCGNARDNLSRWMRNGFPHSEFRWNCDLSRRRKTCSKGLGPAPRTIAFHMRRE
jgi:hypothetical protein